MTSALSALIADVISDVRRYIGAATGRHYQLDYIDVALACRLYSAQLRLLVQPLGIQHVQTALPAPSGLLGECRGSTGGIEGPLLFVQEIRVIAECLQSGGEPSP